MFCSIECREQSLKRYHKYECPVMDQLLKSASVHMPLRQFFIALSYFNGSVEHLREFFKANESLSATIFDFDMRSQDSENDKNHLLALRSLIKSSSIFDLNDHVAILKNHPQLQNIFHENQKFIESFIQRQCQICDLNVHGIFSGTAEKNDDPTTMFSHMQQAIGTGSLLFGALTNHSCANNVFRIYVEGKVAYSVCRPIKKGDQLFDCYKWVLSIISPISCYIKIVQFLTRASFVKQPKAERQTKLLNEYGFFCDCEACTNEFPTPPDLSFKDFKLFKFAKKANDDILKLHPGQAMKKYVECCDILEKNHQNFPCMELCLLQKCIATFLLKQTQPSTLLSWCSFILFLVK